MQKVIVTQPIIEPVTYEEMKSFLRVDLDIEQPLIESYISTAREFCENYQNKTYLTKQIKLVLDNINFPITVPDPPLQSVDKIEFQKEDGTVTEWDVTNYIADKTGRFGLIRTAEGYSIPEGLSVNNKLQITYTAGYSSAAEVSERIKTAIKLLVSVYYEKRLPTQNAMHYEIPYTIEALLNQNRVVPV